MTISGIDSATVRLTTHVHGVSAWLWSVIILSIHGQNLILTKEHKPLKRTNGLQITKHINSMCLTFPKICLTNVVIDNFHVFLHVADW